LNRDCGGKDCRGITRNSCRPLRLRLIVLLRRRPRRGVRLFRSCCGLWSFQNGLLRTGKSGASSLPDLAQRSGKKDLLGVRNEKNPALESSLASFLFIRLLSRPVFSFSGLGGTRRLRRGSTGCVRAGWKKIGASTISLSTPCCAKRSLRGRNYLGGTSTLCSVLTHDRKIGNMEVPGKTTFGGRSELSTHATWESVAKTPYFPETISCLALITGESGW